jgi:hypothetical protein
MKLFVFLDAKNNLQIIFFKKENIDFQKIETIMDDAPEQKFILGNYNDTQKAIDAFYKANPFYKHLKNKINNVHIDL